MKMATKFKFDALAHQYRQRRAHQLETYGDSGLYQDGRSLRQFTGGGASYGMHAIAAYWSARAHLHFMADLKRTLRK